MKHGVNRHLHRQKNRVQSLSRLMYARKGHFKKLQQIIPPYEPEFWVFLPFGPRQSLG